MRIIDLRSDTVTQPTPAMRRAMADAEVGDDVFGEDPTVRRLEEIAAECMGKEAALFVVSGTMANLVCSLTHCGRGDEMILGDQSHIFFYEQGGTSALGGIHPRIIPNQPDGKLNLEDIEAAIRPDNIHFPVTRVIALENTHNRCNGSPLDAEYMQSAGEIARKYGLKIHLDGARIFNAAVALETDVRELTRDADSVSFCLSKGLAAPAGSLVCGSKEFIARARRSRKLVGGAMRQAGVLAAAGIVAMTEMADRLSQDHFHARKLAEGLANIKGISADKEKVKTNIVFFEITRGNLTAQTLSGQLNSEGVRMLPLDPFRLRAVTHYHITSDDIEYVLKVFAGILK
ncbi:MAG: low-specificity L-threonine aldolase [Desulfobacteraceae bacterium IS3]|nr:MAG: low-specificity L-threonine aldolase [Desulfobacteraceae bacterium IS3]